ncbi:MULTISPECIES: hypothetical protein [Moorena]|uniref:Uncharacterized protein n=1 Tax=Moorena producens 3L TaxID=489825 RepID=F4Y2A4_9CYAN|nr:MULTISPECIES: hypothetical protein [Moorena]NEP52354.1 hypothetical protein [Moorena sp. SIO3C2]NEQ14963.1 hypothetical protein [Moorena sp. SIO3E2]EGJ29396.1 hypothetical protein LYNGBM3L_66020 [Moorena producens 3L]NEQ09970.1 hypothetical protein [Moorena sp. SIO4E2]OLT64406.1 hypothetical protein BI334_04650 [Moorena producens 3L]
MGIRRGMGILPVTIFKRAVPTKREEAENDASPWVVRYGAGCPNTGYEVEHEGKPAPNAPYAPYATFPYCLLPIAYCLFRQFVCLQPRYKRAYSIFS